MAMGWLAPALPNRGSVWVLFECKVLVVVCPRSLARYVVTACNMAQLLPLSRGTLHIWANVGTTWVAGFAQHWPLRWVRLLPPAEPGRGSLMFSNTDVMLPRCCFPGTWSRSKVPQW